ncbi:cyclopropane-fatty-acyl-phospholipid synthase family protein [Halobacteriovorax sp.]|uniref:SAM-dependent methyltransferase n=1 Tax=Halobacteriovorax sp. TaxID=2020862 RepID=UPI003569F6BD
MKQITKFINNLFFVQNAPTIFEKAYVDINKSKSYREYCKELHQVDFPCWNTLSINQKSFLELELSKYKIKSLLDIGSGNGEMTKYLCSKYECQGTGIDFAQSPQGSNTIHFFKTEFLKKKLDQKYSAVVSIDSFYMINNYKKYLKKVMNHLESDGVAIIIFSLTMNTFENSKISKALHSLNLDYSITDFTKDDLDFWTTSQQLLDLFNEKFVDEGKFNLWNIKKKEADKNVQLHNSNNISRLGLIIRKG